MRASFLGHIAKVKWVTLDNAAHFLYVDQRGWYMELVGVFFGGGLDVWGSASAGVGQRRGVLVALVMVSVCFRIMLLCITLPFLSRVIVLLP